MRNTGTVIEFMEAILMDIMGQAKLHKHSECKILRRHGAEQLSRPAVGPDFLGLSNSPSTFKLCKLEGYRVEAPCPGSSP